MTRKEEKADARITRRRHGSAARVTFRLEACCEARGVTAQRDRCLGTCSTRNRQSQISEKVLGT